ncbi:hypothetical protein SAMN06272765_4873 [Streptomyces sp. Ag109_G2-15]|nr:hypothetical protein SAMN06272765_4873 [Streptomyces sp. Ag109_G2-15]
MLSSFGDALRTAALPLSAASLTEALRGLLVAGFALAVSLGQTSIGLLILPAFTLTTLFDNASTALLPAVVETEARGSGNARPMSGQQIAGGRPAPGAAPCAGRSRRDCARCGATAPCADVERQHDDPDAAAQPCRAARPALIPARKPDVPVVAPQDGITTAHGTR